jgi:hypothetical protein
MQVPEDVGSRLLARLEQQGIKAEGGTAEFLSAVFDSFVGTVLTEGKDPPSGGKRPREDEEPPAHGEMLKSDGLLAAIAKASAPKRSKLVGPTVLSLNSFDFGGTADSCLAAFAGALHRYLAKAGATPLVDMRKAAKLDAKFPGSTSAATDIALVRTCARAGEAARLSSQLGSWERGDKTSGFSLALPGGLAPLSLAEARVWAGRSDSSLMPRCLAAFKEASSVACLPSLPELPLALTHVVVFNTAPVTGHSPEAAFLHTASQARLVESLLEHALAGKPWLLIRMEASPTEDATASAADMAALEACSVLARGQHLPSKRTEDPPRRFSRAAIRSYDDSGAEQRIAVLEFLHAGQRADSMPPFELHA